LKASVSNLYFEGNLSRPNILAIWRVVTPVYFAIEEQDIDGK
jgi:hypothetical protein